MKYLFILVLVFCTVTFGYAQHSGHPRLFFTASQIQSIMDNINQNPAAGQLYGEVVQQSDYYLNHSLWQYDDFPHNKAAYYAGLPSLAFRYLITGDVQWANRAKTMIFNVDPNPFNQQGIIYDDWYGRWPHDAANGSKLLRALSQKVICLSIMYDWLYDQLDATQRAQIQDTIILDLSYTFPCLQFGGTDMGGIREDFNRTDITRLRMEHNPLALLLAAMSLYGENSNYSTTQADQDIETVLSAEFTDAFSHINRYFSPYDGAELDGISYALWMLPILVTELEAWNRWDGVNHWNDQTIKDRFSKLADWLAYEVLPYPREWSSDMFNTLNDAYTNQYGSMGMLLVLSAKYPEKAGLMRWVFNNTVQNIGNLLYSPTSVDAQQEIHGNSFDFILPITTGYNFVDPVEPSTILPQSRFLSWNGLVEIRTSQTWGDANDIQFAFSSQPTIHPLTGVVNHHHENYDRNNFTLFAYGDRYLIDYGLPGRNTPEWHNLVLIDGVGQAVGLNTQGEISEFATSPNFDFIHGNATRAHNEMMWGIGMPPTIWTVQNPPPAYYGTLNPVQQAHRYVTFSRAMDNIPAYFVIADDIQKDGNTHAYNWRFQTSKTQTAPNPIRLSGTNGNYLDMWFAATTDLAQSGTSMSTVNPVVNPYFHVALVPYKSGSGCATPSYATTVITNGSIVSLTWSNGYTDYSVFKYQNDIQASGLSVVTDAKLSRIRFVTGSGAVSSFVGAEGTTLTYNGQELMNLYEQQGTVMKSGTNVDITSSSVTYFRVYSPNTTSVTLNGASVGFVQIGDYVESNNVTVDRIWSGLISTNYSISVGAKLTISPGSIFKFATEKYLGINSGKLIANGTSSQPITFTSSSSTPQPGDWYGIACLNGGADTLTYCNISYAENGITFYNTNPNSYMKNVTVTQSLHDGVQVSNVSTSNTTLKLSNCNLSNNRQIGLNVSNAKVSVTKCYIETNGAGNINSGVEITNAGKVYFDSSYIQNNVGSGIDVSGSGSRISLSTDEIQRGYNTLYQHGVSELYVHNSATALLGYTEAIPYCDCIINEERAGLSLPDSEMIALTPSCPAGCVERYHYYPRAGWNNVTNSFTYSCRLINNTTSTQISARYNYWGTGSNMFCGPVDASNPQGGPVSKQYMATGDEVREDPDPSTNNLTDIVNWLKRLKSDVEVDKENAIDALHQLALYVGPGGSYSSAIDVPWEFFLAAIEKLGKSENVKRLATAMRIQARLDQGQYQDAIDLSNQVISKTTNDDLWMYCQTRKIFARVGMGDVADAKTIFNSIKSRASGIDSKAVEALQDYLNLSSMSASGNSNPSERFVQSSTKPASYSVYQNYPNPFNPMTQIRFDLKDNSFVKLTVYDILGREVKILVNEYKPAGSYDVEFNASKLPSGIYFYKLQTNSFVDVKKMLLVK